MSERTKNNIRKEGCFILRMLSKDIAECKAIQDGKIFQCPRNLLVHVDENRKIKRKLNEETSNRHCGCGLPSCDQNSLKIFKSLRQMGMQVPKYKRGDKIKNVNAYIKHLRSGGYFIARTLTQALTHTHNEFMCRRGCSVVHTSLYTMGRRLTFPRRVVDPVGI